MAAATAMSALVTPAQAQSPGPAPANRQRTLIKGGYVASLDSVIGEIESGGVLIDGTGIAEIGRNINAPDAEVVDAREKVVLPGLIDTHRHTWETATRSWILVATCWSSRR